MIKIWEHYPAQDVKTYAPIPLPILEGGVTDVIYCPFCRDLFIQVDVAGMVSGESITGRVEGSLDGITWCNLDATGTDTTISVNGMTLMSFTGALPPYIRASGFTTTNEDSEATLALQFHIAVMV